MLRECLGVRLVAELMQQLRRALDVREEERDGSRWKSPRHRSHDRLRGAVFKERERRDSSPVFTPHEVEIRL
jgi:hypothetical protein